MRWTATHVRLGESADRAWCGRYVGFHAALLSMSEDEMVDALERRGAANVCGSCRRSLAAGGPDRVRSLLAGEDARRRARALTTAEALGRLAR